MAPGAGAPGKTGSISPITAGNSVIATVEVVDTYFNLIVNHSSEAIHINTSDPNDVEPPTQTILVGQPQIVFTLQPQTKGPATATDPGSTCHSAQPSRGRSQAPSPRPQA